MKPAPLASLPPSSRPSADELEVAQAAALPVEAQTDLWLVRHLWSRGAVGLISGHPKIGKTWLGLDVAISVASGTDCLGLFPVDHPGPALVYLAEDALPRVRERIASLCAARHIDLDTLPLYVITATSLRLDDLADRDRLTATVARFAPRLLLLDPLVRLHAGDENDSRYIAGLLGFLRTLSRRHKLSIALVHHMSKKTRRQLGQALRGSSDLWAWSDSAAYLTRFQGQIVLNLEHRAAAAPEPIALVLAPGPDGQTPHLECAPNAASFDMPAASARACAPHASATQHRASASPSPAERIMQTLAAHKHPLSRLALREAVHINNQRLGDVLAALEREGSVHRTAAGWHLAPPPPPQMTVGAATCSGVTATADADPAADPGATPNTGAITCASAASNLATTGSAAPVAAPPARSTRRSSSASLQISLPLPPFPQSPKPKPPASPLTVSPDITEPGRRGRRPSNPLNQKKHP